MARSRDVRRLTLDSARRLLPLAIGLLAIGVGTLAGWDRTLEGLLISPAPFIRVVLGIAAGLLGLVLVARAAERVGDGGSPANLVRSLRIVFLAVAAFAASAGWFLASPMPIVAGLVIAGIDVLETSFLLLVTAVRHDAERDDGREPGPPAWRLSTDTSLTSAYSGSRPPRFPVTQSQWHRRQKLDDPRQPGTGPVSTDRHLERGRRPR